MIKKITTIILSAMMFLSVVTPIKALEDIDRIKGSNNYETAVKISEMKSYSSVILINADKTIADGLSAAALAGATNGVILLTSKDNIPKCTQEKINNVNNIYIIGNKDAVSEEIEKDLKYRGKRVERIGGSDRYETSNEVAQKVINITGEPDKVFIANGAKGEADIVSVSPISYRDKSPILLTNGKYISEDLIQKANKAGNRYIIGGDAVVGDIVKNSIESSERIGGSDRFSTNKKIIDKFYSNPKEFNIVGSTDYTMAVVSCSISTEKPVVLVDYRFNPIALKNAREITAIGNIGENDIAKAIGYSGGLENYNYDWTKNRYIAHAMGGIDRKTYTNSIQALEQNYKKGFRVFEIDLTLSKDNQLIAWHPASKEKLKEMGIPLKYYDEKPTVEEFKKLKYYGKYNTMTYKEALSYMKKYKDMYLVIDFKNSMDANSGKFYKQMLEETDPDVIDRIIPQVYNKESYNELSKIYKFKSVILTTYKMGNLDENDITNFCAMNGIKVLVIEGRRYTPSLIEKCNARVIKVYMNTYNSQKEVDSYRKKGAYGFYTDFLTP